MSGNLFSRLSASHLKRAAALKERIEQLELELAGILGIPESLTIAGTMRRHRKISAAARAKISATAKSRWAKLRASKKG